MSEWKGNLIPNPWAWTDKHLENSNEDQYGQDAPKGVPAIGTKLH
jgi:hypothetical protein